jgi:hypothetical protein
MAVPDTSFPITSAVSSSEEEDMDGSEEEDGHDREEKHAHDSEEDDTEQDHWNANGDKENEVHSDSRTPMLNTIDKLTELTACSLLDGTMELALVKVFPFQKACHSVPVQDGYVVVLPTYVWANAGHYPLLVPIDVGDVVTLAGALVQRIQWPKDRIIIPPMTRHPNLEAATGSRGTTSDAGATAQCQQEKAQQQQQISKTMQQERLQQPEEEPRKTSPKQQLQLEDNQQTKQQPVQQQERRQQQEEPRQTTPKQQLQHEDKQQTKQQPLQQQEEERRQSPPKQKMQQVQQPLQQE